MATDLIDEDQAGLLDLVDDLADLGIQHEIPLPTLIVCGDQSAGKSSLLQAISDIKLPIHAGQCTKFPIQISLRRARSESYKVKIRPASSANNKEIARMKEFSPSITSVDDLCATIQDAAQLMGLNNKTRLSEHVLVVEVKRPDSPNLTLVDLPGLIAATPDSESRHQIKMIRKLVESYLKNKDSIILAVVSAQSDFYTQGVLDMVKQHDPTGSRTIGVITKPDLRKSEERLGDLVQWARNEKTRFHLGWHVVRNGDTDTATGQDCSQPSVEDEVTFFSGSPWDRLNQSQVGVSNLKDRLSSELRSHASKHLPELMSSVEASLRSHQQQLAKLGTSRDTIEQQKVYLADIAEKFQNLTFCAVNGHYSGEILRSKDLKLRSQIETVKRTFVYQLLKYGSKYNIECEHDTMFQLQTPKESGWQQLPQGAPDFNLKYQNPEVITCEEHAQEVEADHLTNTRCLTLPGTTDSAAVWEVTKDLMSPVEAIVKDHVGIMFKRVDAFVSQLLNNLTCKHTLQMLMQHYLGGELSKLEQRVFAKVTELMAPLKDIPPNTWDPKLTRVLVKLRNECPSGVQIDPYAAADSVAAVTIVHQSYAYFRAKRLSMIDNVIELAVENCLLADLQTLFTPTRIGKIDEHIIPLLASESDDATLQRLHHEQMCRNLSQARTTCLAFRTKVDSGVNFTRVQSCKVDKTASNSSMPSLTPASSPSPPVSRLVTPQKSTKYRSPYVEDFKGPYSPLNHQSEDVLDLSLKLQNLGVAQKA